MENENIYIDTDGDGTNERERRIREIESEPETNVAGYCMKNQRAHASSRQGDCGQ